MSEGWVGGGGGCGLVGRWPVHMDDPGSCGPKSLQAAVLEHICSLDNSQWATNLPATDLQLFMLKFTCPCFVYDYVSLNAESNTHLFENNGSEVHFTVDVGNGIIQRLIVVQRRPYHWPDQV